MILKCNHCEQLINNKKEDAHSDRREESEWIVPGKVMGSRTYRAYFHKECWKIINLPQYWFWEREKLKIKERQIAELENKRDKRLKKMEFK